MSDISISNTLCQFDRYINQVNKFISVDSKYKKNQIDHLDSKAKKTLLKIEEYLLKNTNSKIENMRLSESELKHLSTEITDATNFKYQNINFIQKIGLFFRNLFTINRKLNKNVKKVRAETLVFKNCKIGSPQSGLLTVWNRIIKEATKFSSKKISIEDRVVGYFKNRKMEIKEEDKTLKDIIKLSRMRIHNEDTKNTLNKMINQIVSFSQKEMAKAGGTSDARTADRTPNEVLINLLAFLDKHPVNSGEYSKQLKEMFLRHTVDLESVKRVLDRIITKFQTDSTEFKYLVKLKNQLPSDSTKMPLTRKHENIYGRVFETALINQLVENPPDEVKTAINATSKNLIKLLKSIFLDEKGEVSGKYRGLLYKFRNFIKKNDKRFWFPQVEKLSKIGKLDEYKTIYESLINYLSEDKNTGFECISIPYTLVKLIVLVEQYQRRHKVSLIPWMNRTNENYQLIVSQTSRVKRAKDLYTEGAGITLPHQPSAQHEEWMTPSQRPSTFYQLQIDQPSKSARQALERGVPWGGGVSGSTNVALFTLHNFNKDNDTKIDPISYLLGTIMFLTYDGGHSIHEALWTGNQLNTELNLGFNLSDEDTDPKEFVADYVKFQSTLKGDSAIKFESAVDKAFEKVIEYYNEHSYYKVE